jgi:hypothetical protein
MRSNPTGPSDGIRRSNDGLAGACPGHTAAPVGCSESFGAKWVRRINGPTGCSYGRLVCEVVHARQTRRPGKPAHAEVDDASLLNVSDDA